MNHFFLILFGMILVSLSCVQYSGRRSVGQGSYLTADLEGLEEDDQDLPGIQYTLRCSDQQSRVYTVMGQPIGRNKVNFSDTSIRIGDQCALDITTGPIAGRESDFEWLAERNNQRVAWLFYSSDLAVVKAVDSTKYLSLKLFKVYRLNYKDPFTVNIVLDFNREEGDLIPQLSGMVANLSCKSTSNATEFSESSAEIIPAQLEDSKRTFIFKVSAQKMKNTECQKISVRIQDILSYEGKLSGVQFSEPKANETPGTNPKLNFGPYKVQSVREKFGEVKCLVANTLGGCNQMQLPGDSPIWFALLRVASSVDANLKSVLVTYNLGLNPDLNGNLKSVEDFNQVIQSGSTDKYIWYKATAKNSILNSAYQPTELLTKISPDKVLSNGVQALTVQAITEVYVQGFRTVSEGFLNKLDAARWMAIIEVNDGAPKGRFIVGGGKKYFETEANKKPAAPAFFTVNHYRKNLIPSDSNYRTYAFKDSFFTQQGCTVELSYFTDVVGQKTASEINSGNDSLIESCEVKDVAALNKLASQNLILAPRFYLKDWHRFVF